MEREQAALEEEERQLAAAEAAASKAAIESLERQRSLDSQVLLQTQSDY